MYMHVVGFRERERGPQEKREKSQGSERESNAIWGGGGGGCGRKKTNKREDQSVREEDIKQSIMTCMHEYAKMDPFILCDNLKRYF